MSLNIVPNSTSLLISGLVTLAGGVVAAVWLPAFWPLVFVLVGLLMAFRLVSLAWSLPLCWVY